MTVLGEGRDTLLSIHVLQDTGKWLAARILIYTAVEDKPWPQQWISHRTLSRHTVQLAVGLSSHSPHCLLCVPASTLVSFRVPLVLCSVMS